MLSISDNSSATILLILSFNPRQMAVNLQRTKARLVCSALCTKWSHVCSYV